VSAWETSSLAASANEFFFKFLFSKVAMVMTTRLAAQSTNPFQDNDREHAERCDRIGPPPAKERIECESDKQDGGEISADVALVRVSVERITIYFGSSAPLSASEQRHNNDAGAGVHDTEVTDTRRLVSEQIVKRIERDVSSQSEKTDADQSVGKPFTFFRARIIAETPEQNAAGRHLDNGIDAKANESHTAGA
jgi:hypothetical protein